MADALDPADPSIPTIPSIGSRSIGSTRRHPCAVSVAPPRRSAPRAGPAGARRVRDPTRPARRAGPRGQPAPRREQDSPRSRCRRRCGPCPSQATPSSTRRPARHVAGGSHRAARSDPAGPDRLRSPGEHPDPRRPRRRRVDRTRHCDSRRPQPAPRRMGDPSGRWRSPRVRTSVTDRPPDGRRRAADRAGPGLPGVDERSAAAVAADLAPGGILAVLTHSHRTGGRLLDPTGAVIAALQDADLLYLQHIVIVEHPLRPQPEPHGPSTRGRRSPTPPSRNREPPAEPPSREPRSRDGAWSISRCSSRPGAAV